jgi:CRISPR-associated endonuclease/helicase Cas3
VIDEIQLCAESTTTLRQVAAFARMSGTAEPFADCMSATVPEGLLGTVDNRCPATWSGSCAGAYGELALRLDAARTIRRLAAGPADCKAIAAAARDRHRPGTLTLVVFNTVDAAREVYKQLRGR